MKTSKILPFWGIPPVDPPDDSEKFKCPSCYKQVSMKKDAFREKHYTTLECGCRFSEKCLRRYIGGRYTLGSV